VPNKMLIDLPERIETARLILRPYRAGDGEAYHVACLRNREHLLPYERGNPALDVETVDDAEALVRQFGADWVARKVFFLGAWEKATGEFVAQIYVGVVSWRLPEFMVGYWVDAPREGQGYVAEAVRGTLAGLVFGPLGAHRARLECNEMNERSQRVAERCGFTREGHIRQTRPNVLLPDGSYSGDYVYGLLRSEWEQTAH
jgi:RimJ/RimL family protein N-acetyltransferase